MLQPQIYHFELDFKILVKVKFDKSYDIEDNIIKLHFVKMY